MRPQDRPIVEALAQQVGGQMGIRTPAGPIDIVTPQEAILVSHVRWYKDALAYAAQQKPFLLTGIKPRLHCWGTTDPVLRLEVKAATQIAVMDLTWEETP